MMLKQRKESTITYIIPIIARYIHTNVSEMPGRNISAVARGNSSILDSFIVKKYDNDHSRACFSEKSVLFIIPYTMNLTARNITNSKKLAAKIMRLPRAVAGIVFWRYTKVIMVE